MDIKKLLKAYEPPFICDNESAMVVDQQNRVIVDVRGWSTLSKVFEQNEAFEFQLEVARFFADRLNEFANPSSVLECKENSDLDDEDGPTEEDIEDERDRKYFNGSSYE